MTDEPVRILRLDVAEEQVVLDAAELFDGPPDPSWTRKFLTAPGHHLLMAFDGEVAVAFVSGVEMVHPDKGTEMLVYELGTHEDYRRQGIGKALVAALADLAAENGCYGMWVGTEHDNVAALATYRSAGFASPESGETLTLTFGSCSG